MKIESVSARNFLALRDVESMSLGLVTLICGDNRVGKTSLQNAIRLALCGEVSRVKLKGDWPQLIRDTPGVKEATVDVAVSNGNEGQNLQARIPKTGKASIPVYEAAGPLLPYALDPTKYQFAKESDRRKVLLELAGEFSTEDLIAELKAADADMNAVAEIMPLVVAGWDAAVDEAKERAKLCRAEWVRITGEAYGVQKGHEWSASVAQAEKSLREMRPRLQPLLDAKAALVAQAEATEDALREAEREAWIAEHALQCPNCGHQIGNPSELEAKQSVAESLRLKLRGLNVDIGARGGNITMLERAIHEAESSLAEAEERTKLAAEQHRKIVTYNQLAELFGPEGVPARLLRGVVERINGRLSIMREIPGLVSVGLAPSGDVEIDYRMGALASESEQWMAYAAVAEALAHLAGVGVVMVDRFDVLSPKNRGAFLQWVRAVAETGTQVILFGTLKQKPEISGFAVHWLEREQSVGVTAPA